MTDDRMALIELIEKGADSDLVRELRAFAADRMMELEVEARTGARAGARSADRLTHRNGYRERAWEDTGRAHRPGHPQAAQGLLPALVPGTAAHGGEGPHRGHPGSLRARDLDAGRRRPRQGAGRLGDLVEPSQ